MPHVNGKAAAPGLWMRRSSVTLPSITQKSIQKSKKRKKQNKLFDSFFLLPYTFAAAQERIYTGLVHQEKLNLALQVPEAPIINGFPFPRAVLAPQNITQGPRLCLVQCQAVNSH